MSAQGNLAAGVALAQVAAPLLPPNAQLALKIAMTALGAIQAAQNGGHDVTDAELAALFDLDAQAKAEDASAQARVG